MTSVSISIDVPDLDAAERFYCDALGCAFARNGAHGIRVLSAATVDIYLLLRPAGTHPYPNSAQARSYDRHWTPIHLDFGVTDLPAAVDRVRDHGGSVEGDDAGDWGAIAYCVDPFGNGFCLIRG